MHGEVRQVHKKRFVFVLVDEADRFVREPVGKILALGAIGQRRNSIRREEVFRARLVGAGDDEVEAVLVGIIFFATQVPLADAGRRVAGVVKHVGHRRFFERQVFRPIGHDQLGVIRHLAGDPIGDVQPGRVFAGEQGGTRRRAHGARGIVLREFHAVARELVDVRRFVELAAVAGQVGPAQIVGEDEDEVRLGERPTHATQNLVRTTEHAQKATIEVRQMMSQTDIELVLR